MSERPSDGWEFDELRDEFDWMFEFNSRMAESIRKDPDVHNLASYVSKLEQENAELRELLSEARVELADMYDYMDGGYAWPSIAEDPSFGPFYRKLCGVLGVEVEECKL